MRTAHISLYQLHHDGGRKVVSETWDLCTDSRICGSAIVPATAGRQLQPTLGSFTLHLPFTFNGHNMNKPGRTEKLIVFFLLLVTFSSTGVVVTLMGGLASSYSSIFNNRSISSP